MEACHNVGDEQIELAAVKEKLKKKCGEELMA